MKGIMRYVLTVAVLLSFMVSSPVAAIETNGNIGDLARAAGYSVDDRHSPKASIVIDAKTGDILWKDHITLKRDPASLTKLMVLYMLYEEMAKGDLTEEDTLTATATDQAISSIYEISNNKIVAGVAYPIKDLIIATLVPSSNASTIMLANYLSDNDADGFLAKMNQKAKALGMQNTTFYNASGAVASAFQGYYKPTQYDLNRPNETTAQDLAILVYHFLKKYPQVLTYTKSSAPSIMVGTPYEEMFSSYNHSLADGRYPFKGVDGLKTGSSPSAGFNGIVTAKQGKNRLIVVVLGVGDWSDQNGEYYRHPFVNGLLAKGFEDYPAYQKEKAAGKRFSSIVKTPSPASNPKASKSSWWLDLLKPLLGIVKILGWVVLFLIFTLFLVIVVTVAERKRRRRRQSRQLREK